MDVIASITVFYEDPFWVAVYQRTENAHIKVCRVVFGAEPKDSDVYQYFLDNWTSLQFSEPLALEKQVQQHNNPKRLQRQAKKQVRQQGVGTKAQQALQLQREQNKMERKSARKERREEEKERQFRMRQQKKREKHKGH